MNPGARSPGLLVTAFLSVSILTSCGTIRDILADIHEICSEETVVVTTAADLRQPCDEAGCSLWGAIARANTCNTGMIVTVPAESRFVFGAPPAEGTGTPESTVFPAITGRLIIQGNGAEILKLRSGTPPDRFFVIEESGNLTIAGLSLQGGGWNDRSSTGIWEGGAFVNRGTLILEDVDLFDNRASGSGGAISNHGQLVIRGGRHIDNRVRGCDEFGGGVVRNFARAVARIENAEFRGNRGCGGGVYNNGLLVISRSSFMDNVGDYGENNTFSGGGAILNDTTDGSPAVATIMGSTFSGNRGRSGAAISNWRAQLTVQSSTFSGNVAHVPCPECYEEKPISAGSPGLVIGSGSEFAFSDVTVVANTCEKALASCGSGIALYSSGTISNSIVADHPSGDCETGTVEPLPMVEAIGANLDSDGSCHGFTFHRSPLLGPLADNGGPTRTHAILPGSPALDAGTRCLKLDQRAEPRAGSADDPCDIGAFELQR